MNSEWQLISHEGTKTQRGIWIRINNRSRCSTDFSDLGALVSWWLNRRAEHSHDGTYLIVLRIVSPKGTAHAFVHGECTAPTLLPVGGRLLLEFFFAQSELLSGEKVENCSE